MALKIVVLTGAGISAESGIKTFRDSNGLWENHNVMDVASPDGWNRNRELVLRFYNERRAQARNCKPNAGHLALVELEKKFEVMVITQNVDDLHEKAGSSRILHLHGELNKGRSLVDPKLIYEISGDINEGDKCERGSQIRPHIVWFGEEVPLITTAAQLCEIADVLLIIGTSMVVYPAASLIEYVPDHCEIFLIDPKKPDFHSTRKINFVIEAGTTGVPKVVNELISRE